MVLACPKPKINKRPTEACICPRGRPRLIRVAVKGQSGPAGEEKTDLPFPRRLQQLRRGRIQPGGQVAHPLRYILDLIGDFNQTFRHLFLEPH